VHIQIGEDQFHVPQPVGKALVAAKLASVVPVPQKFIEETIWRVIADDFSAPIITWRCPNCKQDGHQESPKGTAHESALFRHCGGQEPAPNDIRAKYKQEFKVWQGRAKKIEEKRNTPRAVFFATTTMKMDDQGERR
jgi:hypothetical protein